MAIHTDLPGISVWVSMNGEQAQEYHTENDVVDRNDPEVVDYQEQCTITKYIECTEGQHFAINVAVKRPYRLDCDALSFELKIDGKWIDTELMCRSDYRDSDKNFKTRMKGLSVKIRRGGTLLRPFKFAKIKLAAEQANNRIMKAQQKELEDVGQIELQIDRRAIIRGHQEKRAKHRDMRDLGVDYNKEFQPKPLVPSGKTHGSKFGKPKLREQTEYIHSETIDGDDYPLLIFKFKYRSKKALQYLDLIPRSPEPEPVPRPEIRSHADRQSDQENQAKNDGLDYSHLTAAEMLQLQEFLKTIKGSSIKEEVLSRKVKREAIENEGSKYGVGHRAKKPKKMAGKVTIDLTGEDSEEEVANRDIVELE